jgi:hypothetical protein
MCALDPLKIIITLVVLTSSPSIYSNTSPIPLCSVFVSLASGRPRRMKFGSSTRSILTRVTRQHHEQRYVTRVLSLRASMYNLNTLLELVETDQSQHVYNSCRLYPAFDAHTTDVLASTQLFWVSWVYLAAISANVWRPTANVCLRRANLGGLKTCFES